MIGLIWLGWWMVGLGYFDSWYNRALSIHRSVGIVLLGLGGAFAIWKIVSPSPRLQSELQPWERHGARLVHFLLICAMFILPVSGYVISTSAGSGFPFFGIWEVPAVLPRSEFGRNLAISAHVYISYGLIVVIALHAGAAIKHQFLDRHGTLRRMLW